MKEMFNDTLHKLEQLNNDCKNKLNYPYTHAYTHNLCTVNIVSIFKYMSCKLIFADSCIFRPKVV